MNTHRGAATVRTRRFDADVVAWRRAQLEAARFPAELARRVARDPRLDLHALIELVECGCRPDLAVRIMAPLDDSDGA